MAEYLNKVTIQTPTKKLRDFDLSCQHLTTQTFMRPSIAYAKEFFGSKDQGTKIKLNLKTYSRMEPMLRPVLGSMQIRNRVFFVPFRQVWQSFNNFLVDSPVARSTGGAEIPSNVPFFKLSNLASVIIDNYTVPHTASVGEPDFLGVNNAPLDLTADGRQAVKILNALGYQLPWHLDAKQYPDLVTYTYSFLPLLCAAKVFIDWYYPAEYAHSGEYINIDGILQRYDSYEASYQDIWSCLSVLQFVFYDNDYFTAQWDTPVSPAPGTFSSMSIDDITYSGFLYSDVNYPRVSNDQNSPNGTALASISLSPTPGGNYYQFSQFLIDSLKSVTNYQKRHQLVGSRVIDRMLADFGVVTKWEQLKRSYYIGSQVFPVQISDVMSNSDTLSGEGSEVQGAQLGQYAGKGIAFDGDGNFEFETNEFGMFLVFNSVVPDVTYIYQVDRQVLHKTRLDFYSPEFDGLGVQAISKGEVRFNLTDSKEVFGFLPMYSDYKSGFDRVTGSYVIRSQMLGLQPWSTYRSLQGMLDANQGSLPSHSIEFNRGSDAAQYCRLFYGYNGEEFDVFYMVHRINIKVSMGASPMYDTYQFDEPEGDVISMQANGAQLS